jgi:hypothetical protein
MTDNETTEATEVPQEPVMVPIELTRRDGMPQGMKTGPETAETRGDVISRLHVAKPFLIAGVGTMQCIKADKLTQLTEHQRGVMITRKGKRRIVPWANITNWELE